MSISIIFAVSANTRVEKAQERAVFNVLIGQCEGRWRGLGYINLRLTCYATIKATHIRRESPLFRARDVRR